MIETLRRVDLSTALNGKYFDLGGRQFTLGRVAKANVEELRQAAHAIFLEDWVPSGNGRGPVRGGVIDSYCMSDWEDAREPKPSLVEDDGKDEAVSGAPALEARTSEVDDPTFLEWQNAFVEEAEALTKVRPYAELEQMDPHGSFQAGRTDAHLELFQLEAVAAMDRHYARPGARGLLCLATGGGKTRTSLEWLMKRVLARGERVLWVTHRLDLLDQVHEELRGLAWLVKESRPAGFSVSRLQGDLQNLTGDIVLASAATLARRQPSRQDLSIGRKLGIVVYDEAHRAVATNTYQALTKLLGHNEVPFLGLTATPYRLEAGGTELLRNALGETIYEKSFKELIELGFLARPVWYRQRLDSLQRVQVTASEQQSIRSTGDFSRHFLTEFARTPGRTRQIVEHWVRAREHYGKTIVFACDIDHAEALTAEFLRHQVRAESIHNQHSTEKRTATIQSFREHGLEVLVNVGILTEGFNVPKTRTVVMARPTLSKALYVQMIGRAARGPKTVPGKDTFYVVDCVDNYNVHGLELAGQAVAADLVRESSSRVVTVTRSVKDLTENEERAARRSAVLGATRLLGRGFDPRMYTLWGELRWSSPSGDVAVAVFNESLYELQSAVALTIRNEWALARQRTQSLDMAGAVRAVDWDRALNDCERRNTPLQLIALRDLRLCDEDFALATALHQLVGREDAEVLRTWETSELLKRHYPTTGEFLEALAALRPQPAPEPAAAAEVLPAPDDAL
ncbi:MAG: DEAD/DEAH box helicase, partial [Deltaproteobacteria bacterium]|nr:DEAD/DEAH box helicase [Deltaproteobacteria bacterium]